MSVKVRIARTRSHQVRVKVKPAKWQAYITY